MRSLGGMHIREWPLDVTMRGVQTEGFIGPVFLLLPLALLALATPLGRQLLIAAAVFLAPYPAAIAARFLLPALTFLALALGLAVSRWKYVAAGVVGLHALLSWPQVIPEYLLLFTAFGPSLETPDWRAALRLTPESEYLGQQFGDAQRVDGYGLGALLDTNVATRERVLSFRTFQQAYHSRHVLVEWESAERVRLGESVRAAIDPQYRAMELHRFSFPPRSARRVRLVQMGRTTDQWSLSEFRIFREGRELPRAPEWRLRASPNPWDIPLAFDNSPLTRWASRQPATPGMYIEVDFGRPQTIYLVTAQSAPGQTGIKMELQFETAPGEWRSAGSRHEVIPSELPPLLRRAAMENLLRQNVQWLMVHDLDPGARDFLLQQPQWGIKLAGRSARYRLYHLDPIVVPSISTPMNLEGFYNLENGRYRWTRRNFAVTFAKLDRTAGQPARLTLSLYIPESSIQKLGPITLTARLGIHVLAPATFRQSGNYAFEREIDPQWLTAGPNRIEFSLDKSIPPTPADQRELGIIVNEVMLHN